MRIYRARHFKKKESTSRGFFIGCLFSVLVLCLTYTYYGTVDMDDFTVNTDKEVVAITEEPVVEEVIEEPVEETVVVIINDPNASMTAEEIEKTREQFRNVTISDRSVDWCLASRMIYVEAEEPEPVEEKKEEPKQEPIKQINIYEPEDLDNINVSDITKPSGLTADQYNTIIDNLLNRYNKTGSKLYGLGESIYNAEMTYGNLNGLFLLGIVSNESGWGMHTANTNNIAGITSKSGFRAYNSVNECVMDMARLLSEKYIGQGRTTIAAVGDKYCPSTELKPNQNIKWRNTVSKIMNQYIEVAEKMY